MPKRSVTEVLEDIAEVLRSADGVMSTKEIAERKGLDWKTTQKYLGTWQFLSHLGILTLVKDSPNIKLWRLEKRGLLSLPESERLEKVRKHFPEVDSTDILLAKLLIKGSTDREKALGLQPEEQSVARLLAEAGHLVLEQGKAYLTETGASIARGLLKIYPELIKTV